MDGIRECGADLVHIHSPRAGLLGRLAARLLGLPVLVTVHIPSYLMPGGRVRNRVYMLAEGLFNHTMTDEIVYVSRRLCAQALASHLAPPGRTRVIPNWVEPTEPTSVEGSPLAVCFVGRLDVQKGVDILLAAVALLPSPDEIRLAVVGDGPRRSALEALAAARGLSPITDFLGERHDVSSILRRSQVFVLPSRYEAMPLALLEAMSAGLACIATDVGDNAEVLGDAGLIVPAGDPGALAQAMLHLLRSPHDRRRLGQAARIAALRYRTSDTVGRILLTYDEMLARSSGASTA